jgi:hypothetical protein
MAHRAGNLSDISTERTVPFDFGRCEQCSCLDDRSVDRDRALNGPVRTDRR